MSTRLPMARALALGLALVAMAARAADPPTPGQIFQQQQQGPDLQPRLPPKPPPIEEKQDGGDFRRAEPSPGRGPAATSATRRVPVKAFRLVGLTVAPEATVQALLAPHRNRDHGDRVNVAFH